MFLLTVILTNVMQVIGPRCFSNVSTSGSRITESDGGRPDVAVMLPKIRYTQLYTQPSINQYSFNERHVKTKNKVQQSKYSNTIKTTKYIGQI